ncbi:3-isopropylmalate dehydratase small subunit [Calorimonas adulescens]|uniref:3-isopropylmalate dehydratase small subunit n=1 Tax=Calorimonas adulescens TaxID=2606906 RepID=A0A5D8QDA0_9THEO|nr:3-isopropylmalate dehydratase small subunit [Calorimonas adulescens]MDI6601719.1 3-isopropylmalate dehydratase small subunit [Thermoanaerobacteraceae bacterium]TZE81513.1 3-isopropylmalate dehydratase small subunit [Calorimonas adulescens]
MIYRGKAIKYGDNINTDVILPGQYLNLTDERDLAAHCMEGIDSDFVNKVEKGDIIVGGSNFGCGSSREHAPIAIKASGVSCIIAKSFATIFYRNAINIGVPAVECPDAIDEINEGDILEVDIEKGTVKNITLGKSYNATVYPKSIQNLINVGGLVNYVKSIRGVN